MTKTFYASVAVMAALLVGCAQERFNRATSKQAVPSQHTLHKFKKIRLSDKFWAEGAHYGDFNRDGRMDVVSGPYWWEGPDFHVSHQYYPATKTFKTKGADGAEQEIPGFEGALGKKNDYSDNFFAFTYDFNRDGWDDILIYGFPGKDASWYENPKGKPAVQGTNGASAETWKRHKVFDVVDNESPTWVNLVGDDRPELVCNSGGFFGYAEPNWTDPTKPWKWHPVTPKGPWQKFTHGLGVGDVNGDGRQDILEADGWWEQPASLQGDPAWTKHPVKFNSGGAQMYAYDVDGDGLNDVVTSLAAHGHGLAWHQQAKDGTNITFRQHLIMGAKPEDNRYGVKFSQLHAVELVDMDLDGLKDIVTGKRFWAHGSTGDAEPDAPAVVYWFKLVRNPDKTVDFVPYLIDDDSGVGTQVVVGDLNNDKLPDVVVGNKKGVFVHLHQTQVVSPDEWEKAQPQARSTTPAAGATSGKTNASPATAGSTNTANASKPAQTTASPPDTAREAAKAVPSNASLAAGIRPVGRDGKVLNLDFEDGTLKDWKATGNAFDKQPVAGDVITRRRTDMPGKQSGKYLIGTFEAHGDPAQGTLTSAPFKVTHPYASFLVAGGPYEKTRVEVVRADNQEVIFKTTGFDGETFKKSNNATETLSPVVVDLRPHQDKEIFVRLIDEQEGHWAHLNFDDFRFHASKPDLAAATPARKALDTADPAAPPSDDVKFAGLSAEEAAKAITLPNGFSAKLFAGEPDVKQPIAFAIDDRGRLWVAEAFTYPRRAPEGEGKDRIVIFADNDGDGRFDQRTVFKEGLNLVSGLEVGFGGVWVGAAPQLLFIPDKDRDDKPDGDARVLLDGWAFEDTHETLNTFTWGPDGWLYGCHGVFTHSKVGKPGAAAAERTPLNAGIWRFHPVREEFEVFAEGTSNPWGIDFDARGQCFVEACVIPHLFHIIQGARYQRQAGQHFNPYIYKDIQTIADHVHYAGSKGPHAGNNRSDAAGGGHAHAGLMIYQGDSWPEAYRGHAFMNNIHGQRINVDVLEPKGSGFIGKHAPDFLNFNDRWSQVINLLSDQDGSVYMIDWYDKNQCHHNRVDGHDRDNGRIFKVVYDNRRSTPVDLQKLSVTELALMQTHRNDWYARHARRILQERGENPAAHEPLRKIVADAPDEVHRLRALWTLHVTGGLDEEFGLALLKDKSAYVRAWTIQLLCEKKNASDALLKELTRLAEADESPVTRLYIASALQRVPVSQRAPVLAGLFGRAEDTADHNLPLMYWYAAEPVAGESVKSAAALLTKSKIPLLRELTTRRMTAIKNTAAIR